MKREEGPILGPGCRSWLIAGALLLLFLLIPPGPNWRKADYRALQACQVGHSAYSPYFCHRYTGGR